MDNKPVIIFLEEGDEIKVSDEIIYVTRGEVVYSHTYPKGSIAISQKLDASDWSVK